MPIHSGTTYGLTEGQLNGIPKGNTKPICMYLGRDGLSLTEYEDHGDRLPTDQGGMCGPDNASGGCDKYLQFISICTVVSKGLAFG